MIKNIDHLDELYKAYVELSNMSGEQYRQRNIAINKFIYDHTDDAIARAWALKYMKYWESLSIPELDDLRIEMMEDYNKLYLKYMDI